MPRRTVGGSAPPASSVTAGLEGGPGRVAARVVDGSDGLLWSGRRAGAERAAQRGPLEEDAAARRA